MGLLDKISHAVTGRDAIETDVLLNQNVADNLIDKLNLVSREILTGIPVIRAFNTEKREEKRFEKATEIMYNNVCTHFGVSN